MKLTISEQTIRRILEYIGKFPIESALWGISIFLSIVAIAYSFTHGYIIAYGDAESHLNIAKRVVSSITPGAAQLGGIWLPLPHLLMVPFVYFDSLWRSGLAGSFISGIAYVISSIFVFKMTYLVTKNRFAAFIAYLTFALNPNILYLQSTPMTELVLIVFFILSSYYFIQYLIDDKNSYALLLAALFGFCATLSRYDGWFLVLFEAAVIVLYYGKGFATKHKKIIGKVLFFSTLAFFGICLWFLWDYLILGDPLYFTHSEFSARSQQLEWQKRNMLPAYHNIIVSFLYYFATAMSNAGFLIFFAGLIGAGFFIFKRKTRMTILASIILWVPFIFNVYTLFAGQSIIFIPHITPSDFPWHLFNVRYGVMMVPAIAFFVGILFYYLRLNGRLVLTTILLLQVGLYIVGYSKVISLEDGLKGLSANKKPDAEVYMSAHYDGGFVLLDDFARAMSIIRSGIPMQKTIYVGNKPYWTQSLNDPERYARWIIIQKNDEVWKSIYDNPSKQKQLYKYFTKVYTSPDVLIFKKQPQYDTITLKIR